jgi:hypothetical protein
MRDYALKMWILLFFMSKTYVTKHISGRPLRVHKTMVKVNKVLLMQQSSVLFNLRISHKSHKLQFQELAYTTPLFCH